MTIDDTNWDFDELATGGTYAKFEKIGDSYTGRIAAFDLEGATDFNGDPCPQLVLETADGIIKVSAGQANLRRQMTEYATRLIPGHGARVTYSSDYETKHGTKGKEFTLGVTPTPVAPVTVILEGDEAPFMVAAGDWWPQAGFGEYPTRMLP